MQRSLLSLLINLMYPCWKVLIYLKEKKRKKNTDLKIWLVFYMYNK